MRPDKYIALSMNSLNPFFFKAVRSTDYIHRWLIKAKLYRLPRVITYIINGVHENIAGAA